uniref:Coiled-coil domain-containing protein 167 n=1 Tax=Meloidogyne floridensis TaxID=298350 RepID=A0A915P436_9BILA
MKSNNKQKKKTIPNELLVDIFKSLNIPPNELELNILEEESTTKIFKQLKKYSKNLLVSSRILTLIVGEVTAILIEIMVDKGIFIREQYNNLVTRMNQLNMSISQRRNEVDEIGRDLEQLRIKNSTKEKNILLVASVIIFFGCSYGYYKMNK